MKIEDLHSMSDEELIQQHNMYQGDNIGVPRDLFLNELHRREMVRQGERMEALTRSIKLLTLIVTVATITGVILTTISQLPEF